MGRIVIDYFGLSILMAVALTAIEYFFEISMPGGAVVSVIAGMVSGQLYGGRTGKEVTSGFAWKVAAVLTAISLVLLVVLVVVFRFLGEELIPAELSTGEILVIGAIAGLVGLGITRFTFRWGVKMGAKNSPNKANPKIFD